MNLTLKAGTVLYIGGAAAGTQSVTLVNDTEVGFDAQSTDHLAEILSMDTALYGAHREELAHEEDGERDGEPVRLLVTYGVGGARQEEVLGEASSGDAQTEIPVQTEGAASERESGDWAIPPEAQDEPTVGEKIEAALPPSLRPETLE